MLFQNRQQAGFLLSQKLSKYKNDSSVLVLALPRGGVAIAHEICKNLNLPCDLILVRKLGVPGQEELAMGAIAPGDIRVFNEDIIHALGLSKANIESVIASEETELERRNDLYRQGKPFPSVNNKTIILVDDGIATGATMRAAITVVKKMHPAKIIVATPVAAPSTCRELADVVDEIICLATPEPLYGIGMWYREFSQLDDNDVIFLMHDLQRSATNEITIQVEDLELGGSLTLPANTTGLVIFAHGSGSSRYSPRNQYVAHALNQEYQLGTLLFDLLTPDEEEKDIYTREFRFDIPLLATRLVATANWALKQNTTQKLSIGFFGSSTGAAAALVAAAQLGKLVKAIVSRGGRPDLAGDYLPQVVSPTLLIVGERDEEVILLNQQAQQQLTAASELVIVPNATHLFEEEGTLDQVIQFAGQWFKNYL